MLVSPLGKDVKARFVQLEKVLLAMLVIPAGKDVKAKFVQP